MPDAVQTLALPSTEFLPRPSSERSQTSCHVSRHVGESWESRQSREVIASKGLRMSLVIDARLRWEPADGGLMKPEVKILSKATSSSDSAGSPSKVWIELWMPPFDSLIHELEMLKKHPTLPKTPKLTMTSLAVPQQGSNGFKKLAANLFIGANGTPQSFSSILNEPLTNPRFFDNEQTSHWTSASCLRFQNLREINWCHDSSSGTAQSVDTQCDAWPKWCGLPRDKSWRSKKSRHVVVWGLLF